MRGGVSGDGGGGYGGGDGVMNLVMAQQYHL